MLYYSWPTRIPIYAVIISSITVIAESDVLRPRGVSIAKASLYAPKKDFTCLDGTVTIPYSYVNDDYCDCFDGSDEPGTPACLNGVFHCTNAGHRAQNIPSSRVNDGICDCCDGTDEYITATCSNTCEELGREARAETQRLIELHKAGSHLRMELIEKGNKKRTEMAEQLSQLENDRLEAERIKDEKEALKNYLESKENEALKIYREAEEQERQKKAEEERQSTVKEAFEQFQRFDSNNDGILTIDEIKVVNVFDKDKDGQVDIEETKYFFGESDSLDKDTFIATTWPLLKPLLMMEQGMFRPAQEEEEDMEHDAGLEESNRDLHTEDLGTDNENLDEDQASEENVEHELEQEPTMHYDEDTQKLVDEATEARHQLTKAERTVQEIESNIRNIKQNLEKDYGVNQEFATMDGQCLEYEDKEYVYRLCLFQKITQKSKNGGSEVGLGNWGEWAGVDNKYSVMKYTNGMGCWNGPNRMTTVNIHCGLETKLLTVSEPFRCEYKIDLSTPAACDESNTTQYTSHDEL